MHHKYPKRRAPQAKVFARRFRKSSRTKATLPSVDKFVKWEVAL